ncbi:sodium ion-translocating decarboxylase subunit beta [uncultured Oscillibacter sp.]|uniref:sodium ion-translocating decarboxylase subunit beta n=1 Tax=uncultured Oscillibacter sp. TaxID=876091 RepID=UPI0025DC6E02|nr:sodium ion-translocating decarboxylase subunit beta [uncultured Oscillibacter sp.]
MELITGTLNGIIGSSGFALMTDFRQLIMIALACVLLYLGIVKKFEPLLLVGIAFGMLLTNLPGGEVYHTAMWITNNVDYGEVLRHGGLLDILYIGVKTGVYPSLIFMGVGAMTDFGPLIARPSSLFMGAAAQGGIFVALLMATLLGFAPNVAASIAIIGGADGPTAIWLTKILAPEYLGPIAIAAYSYMALIPLIQPPIMKLLTTEKERKIKMETLRPVTKTEKIIFPIMVTIVTVLVLPSVAPLLGCLMLGNLFKECGVTDRLSDTVQNALMNIVTTFLGISVGATAVYDSFLSIDTIKIIVLGLTAFAFATACGVLFGKLMCVLSGGKINPLIGSAGVSAVPMAARVSQVVGQKYNPSNFLLMHAMGPNVAGVIGSAVAAGCLLKLFG